MPEIERIAYLFADPNVTDILIGSTATIERNSSIEEIQNPFKDETETRDWIQKVFGENAGRIDISQPISEVSITTGYGLLRVHAVLAGDCAQNTQISIRRHSGQFLSLEDLHLQQTFTLEQKTKLQQIVDLKENFVIVGSTGAGKTTLLRAILNEVSNERVITIEENYELALVGNSVALKTRSKNHEGVGEISLAQLLREALRMRPDRLVIGEARGEELKLLLQSLNTGHSGAGFTLHANSYRQALSRMLAMLNLAGVPSELAKTMIASSVHWLIEISRTAQGRKVVAIERLL
ncbi:MAG: ATPase, T2SS/T4P/T4SS family [Actinomycetes bacterium]